VITQITRFAARNLTPELTFLLDIPASLVHERLHGRRRGHDRMEREQMSFHEKVAEGYRRLAAAEPQRITLLDGTRPKEKLADVIREKVLIAWDKRN
jgi:dTMP kinase